MTQFDEIDQFLRKSKFAGPADQMQIFDAENGLGIQFPPSYRKFLENYGAALCKGFEINGLFKIDNKDEPPLWTNIVHATIQGRRFLGESFPKTYIPISDDGGDYTYYLDLDNRNDGGECPVVVLGPGVDGVNIATNFNEFVLKSFKNDIT